MRFGAILRIPPMVAIAILPLIAALGLVSAPATAGTAKCDPKYSADTKKVTVRCIHQGSGPAQCEFVAKFTCEGSTNSNWTYSFPLPPGQTKDLEKSECVGGNTITGIAEWKVVCQ